MSGTNKLILDTCIVSYFMKKHTVAEDYISLIQGCVHAISFITVGELYRWAEEKKWGDKRRINLEATLRNFIVIPYDNEIARCYGRLVAERNSKGKPIGDNDAWIAACAVRHSVSLVTHNSRDFIEINDLDVITKNSMPD